MKIQTQLTQEQNLQLNITQELVQAITLLQYSALELASFVEEKAAENPLLQVEINYYQTIDPHAKKWHQFKDKEKTGIQTNRFAQVNLLNAPSLTDYLKSQILLYKLNKEEKRALLFFIENIDENGYLTVDIDEACKQLNFPLSVGEKALSILQQLDPPGIGARNLQECLLLQLQRNANVNPIAIKILKDYFYPFVHRKWGEIARKLNITLPEIQKIMDDIQNLDPKPGSQFGYEQMNYIIPDFIVEYEQNHWVIQIVEKNLIHVKLNKDYYHELRKSTDSLLKDYLHEQIQHYRWLKKSILQRQETMFKVMSEIIKIQEDFFLGKQNQIRPMTMKDVAERIGMHESTVSRVIKNKYVRAPFGTYALKDLFSTKIHKENLEEISSIQIKNELKSIIENENKEKPYSDQEIAAIFNKKGIHISRRTIAKYREQIGLPSSNKRKRYTS